LFRPYSSHLKNVENVEKSIEIKCDKYAKAHIGIANANFRRDIRDQS